MSGSTRRFMAQPKLLKLGSDPRAKTLASAARTSDPGSLSHYTHQNFITYLCASSGQLAKQSGRQIKHPRCNPRKSLETQASPEQAPSG